MPRRRRPATYLTILGVVVLLGVAATTVLALHATHGRDGVAQVRGLTGDVDGDGTPDRVLVTRHDRLVVRLATGRTVTQLLEDRPHLEGLVDIGEQGRSIAISSGPHGRDWEVWWLRGSRLVRLSGPATASLSVDRGSSTVWISGHRLYTGTLDPLQQGQTRVGLLARRWAVRDGRLTGHRAGLRCWDRGSTRGPVRCGPGRDWAYDAGPHGDLPVLLPAVATPRTGRRTPVRLGSDAWLVRQLPQMRLGLHRVDLLDRVRGRTIATRVPRGFPPAIYGTGVDLGHGALGVVVSQEGGDQDSWHVYARSGRRLVRLAARGPVELGGGFTSGGDTAYLSWLTPDGHLYTRVGTPRPGRVRVYAWRAESGRGGVPTSLRAVPLGIVCIDDLLGTYGTCAS